MWKNHTLSKALSMLALSAWLFTSVALEPSQALAQVVKGLPDFTELVEQVGPSVVNIRTLEKVKTNASGGGNPDDEMQELFRRFSVYRCPTCPGKILGPIDHSPLRSLPNPKVWARASFCRPMASS